MEDTEQYAILVQFALDFLALGAIAAYAYTH